MTAYVPLTDDSPALAYLDGCALGPGQALIIAAEWGLEDSDDRETTLVLVDSGRRLAAKVDENIIALTRVQQNGQITVWGLSKLANLRQVYPVIGPAVQVGRPGAGRLVALETDGSLIYAAGLCGQILVFDTLSTQWRPIDDGVFQPPAGPSRRFIRDIALSNDGIIVAVGLSGECFVSHPDGQWRPVDIASNIHFERVLYHKPSAAFIIFGAGGAIALYSTTSRSFDDWTWIDSGVEDAIWGATIYKTEALFSTMQGIFRLETGTAEVEPLPMGIDTIGGTYRVDAFGEEIWSIGPEDIAHFDGTAWTRIIIPGTG